MAPKLTTEVTVLDRMSAELVKINNNLTNFTGNVERTFSGLTKGFLAVGALGGVVYKTVDQLKFARREYQEAVKANRSLEAALGYTSEALKEQANIIGRKLKIDDDEITAIQAKVAAYVKNDEMIKKITPAVLDFGAFIGDNTTAANLLGKAIGGTGAEMARYGIKVDGASGSVERINDLLDKVEKKFGGQAKAAAEARDIWDALGIAWKDFNKRLYKDLFGKETADETVKRYKEALERGYETISTGFGVSQVEHTKALTKQMQDFITKYESEQGKKRLGDAMNRLDEENDKRREDVKKLQEDLWKIEEGGKLKLLRNEMKEELELYKNNEEAKILIRRRYGILLKNEEKKGNKGNWVRVDDDELPWYLNDKFIKEEYNKTHQSVEDINKTFEDLGNDLDKNISPAWENVSDSQDEAIEKMRDKAQSFISLGQSFGEAFASGFSGSDGSLKGALQNVLNVFLSFVEKQLIIAITANTIKKFGMFSLPGLLISGAEAAVITGIFELAKSKIGNLASGGNPPSGFYRVGEHGPEDVYLPSQSHVYNATETRTNNDNRKTNLSITIHDSSGNVTERVRGEIRRGGASERMVEDIIRVAKRKALI